MRTTLLCFAVLVVGFPDWVTAQQAPRLPRASATRIAVYVACALAAPPTVWLLQGVARARHTDQRATFFWGMAGAMLFDSLAIGFVPSLYGQTGQALAWTASALLFAFATAFIAGHVMLGRTAAARVGS